MFYREQFTGSKNKFTWYFHKITWFNLLFYFVLGIVAVVLFFIALSMVAGNGFYIFQIFDDYSANIPLLFIGLMQCIAVAWVYGNEKWEKWSHLHKQQILGIEF